MLSKQSSETCEKMRSVGGSVRWGETRRAAEQKYKTVCFSPCVNI